MKKRLFMFAALALAASLALGEIHRWVDKDGNIHYGDTVPPEYAGQARDSRNKPERDAGNVSGDGFSSEEMQRWQAEARQADRDRVLLRTYLTVEEIEEVRDRRIEQMEAKTYVTERYLERLHGQLEDQKRTAARVAASEERRTAEDKAALVAELEKDIASTAASIEDYQSRLASSRVEKERIRQKFADDIVRFRELMGLPPQPAPAEPPLSETTSAEATPAEPTPAEPKPADPTLPEVTRSEPPPSQASVAGDQ